MDSVTVVDLEVDEAFRQTMRKVWEDLSLQPNLFIQAAKTVQRQDGQLYTAVVMLEGKEAEAANWDTPEGIQEIHWLPGNPEGASLRRRLSGYHNFVRMYHSLHEQSIGLHVVLRRIDVYGSHLFGVQGLSRPSVLGMQLHMYQDVEEMATALLQFLQNLDNEFRQEQQLWSRVEAELD